MQPLEIGLSIAVGVLAIIVIILSVVLFKKSKKKGTEAVKIVDGVRYSDGDEGSIVIKESDMILERGKTYTAQKKGQLLPGKYTIYLSIEGEDYANIRLMGIVRSVRNNSELVLAEGDSICPVSQSIILR